MSETNNIKINIALADNTIVTDINSITSHIESLQRLSKKEIALNLRFDKAKDLAKVANEISAAVGDLGNKIQEASQKFNPSGKLKKAASELEEFDKSFRKFNEGIINNKQSKGLKEYWENLYPDKNRAKSTLSRLAKEYNAFIDNFNNKAIPIEDLPDKVFQAERFKKILSDAKYQGDLLKSPVRTGRYKDYLEAYQRIPSNAGKITLDTSLANAELAKLVNVLAMLEKTVTTVPVSANVTEALTKLQEVITKIEEAKNKAKIPIQLNSEMLPKQVAQLSEQIAMLTSGLKDRTKIPIIFDALNVPSQIAAVAERVAVLTSGLKDRGMIPITFDVNSIPSAVKTIATEIERAKHSFIIPVQIKSENIKQIVSEIDGVLNELKNSSNLNAPISIKIDMAALAKDIKALKQRLNSLYSIKKYFHPKIKLDLSEVQAKLSSLRKRLIEFNKSKVTSIKIKADISSVRQSIAQLKEGLKDKEIPAEMAVKIMADNSQFLATVNESLAKLKELKDITVHINSNVKDVIAKEKAQKEAKPKYSTEELNALWESPANAKEHVSAQKYEKFKREYPDSYFGTRTREDYEENYASKENEWREKQSEANLRRKRDNLANTEQVQREARGRKSEGPELPTELTPLMQWAVDKRGYNSESFLDGTLTEKDIVRQFRQDNDIEAKAMAQRLKDRKRMITDYVKEKYKVEKAYRDANEYEDKTRSAVAKALYDQQEKERLQQLAKEKKYNEQQYKLFDGYIKQLDKLHEKRKVAEDDFNQITDGKWNSLARQENVVFNGLKNLGINPEENGLARMYSAEERAKHLKAVNPSEYDRQLEREATQVKENNKVRKADMEALFKQKEALQNIEQKYNAEIAKGNQAMEYGVMLTQQQYDNHKRMVEGLRKQYKDNGGNTKDLAQSQILALGSNAAEVNKANAIKNAMSWQGMFFRGADEKVNYLTSSLNTLYTQLERSPGNKGVKRYVELTEAELKKARKEAEAVQKALDRTNPSRFRQEMGRHFRYIGRAFGFYESYDMLNEAGRTIMEIGEAMANLRTVMPQLHYLEKEEGSGYEDEFEKLRPKSEKEANERMIEQQRRMVQIASDYGNKVDETIESARLWGRMYKDQDTVNLLTAQSAKLAVADNFSVEESTKAVEAAMFQFGMTAHSTAEALAYSNRIIDVYTKLSHNAGVTAQDLAAAVERSGSVAHQAGMEFEFLTALIAQATRSTALSGLTNTSPFMLETA